jgi:mono/diheme cytochrome c family protein
MNTTRIKLVAIILFAIPLLLLAVFRVTPAKASTAAIDDPATVYKTKCQACHTPTATKFYDPAKADDAQVETILKGRKGEKPPFMPSFGDKGLTADDAKAMNEYMKSLRAAK